MSSPSRLNDPEREIMRLEGLLRRISGRPRSPRKATLEAQLHHLFTPCAPSEGPLVLT